MNFAHVQILWLLLVLPPALAAFFWWAARVRQRLLAAFIDARLLAALTTGVSPRRQKIRAALLVAAVACLIIALARPQWHFDWDKIEQRGLDIVVAVDTSKSMLATDIAPNRLARAKLATLDLMQQARSDRLGLVAFAGEAYLSCPLTIDDTAFRQSVEALDVHTIPEGGTAIATAINTALTAFKEGNHFKVMVLLTDGEDNDSEAGALAAAQDAAKAGLKIFTVGIGTAAGDLLRTTDANGNSDYVRDSDGNVVKSHLNERLLKQIAGATGGFYLPLGPQTMDTLYERGIAPLPKSDAQEKLVRRYHEQYQWPLAVAMILLLLEMLLPDRTREAKTARPPAAGLTAGAAKVAALALLLCTLPRSGLASPASALHDYNAGNYTNALAEYERLAETGTNDARLVFNAGAAAYRATNFDEAARLFSEVTAAPDLKLQQRAYYNLGNTQFRQGELKFEPDSGNLDAMEETWKDSLKSYARAVDLNTNDADAVFNQLFVKRQLAYIGQLREAMRRAKQSADEAVRRNAYHQALEIMESLNQTLNSPLAAKKYQDYIKKLKDIDAIATPPHQP
jgi:Ca-activated chloride channel family protein